MKPDIAGPVTEQELQDKAKGRRVTLADVEGNISSEWYFTAADGVYGAGDGVATERAGALSLLTFCVMVLRNGYTVVGQSACADPKNFDREVGQRLARVQAINQIWPLMGYALREEMHREQELINSTAFGIEGSPTYVGTKVVLAWPMSRGEYNKYRGWKLPENEDGEDEGYLIEYTDKVEHIHHKHLGYISWSPKDVFERAYRKAGA